MNIKIDFLWQFEQNGHLVTLDPLLFELLIALESLGSLQQAALQCHVSYRHAWGLMEKWHHILGASLLIKHRGRGAKLSETGKKLLQAQQQLQANHAPQLANQATELMCQLTHIQQPETDYLQIHASHDLVVSALQETLLSIENAPIALYFHESLDSLRALHDGRCDIAGFHLPAGQSGQALVSEYLSYLSPERYHLLYLTKRLQGLMIEKGNPHAIHSFADLSNSGHRFINHPKNSDTRRLLDQLLTLHQIPANTIAGYHQEANTQMAVAASVANGTAHCGFGLAAVAQTFGLDFIPMQWEHYCLAINRQQFAHNGTQALIDCLSDNAFHDAVAPLTGYELERCGHHMTFPYFFETILQS